MKMIQDIIVEPIVTENSMEAMQHKKYTFKVMKAAKKVRSPRRSRPCSPAPR